MANDTLIVGGQEYAVTGLKIENWLGKLPEDWHFMNQKRPGLVNEVILHETVTTSHAATVQVLKARNLGVHLICASDGTMYQHGDLLTDFLWHASQHNPVSIGIEVVNPYYPKFRPENGPWDTVIEASWAGGQYVVPTKEQAEAVTIFLAWVTQQDMFQIPMDWKGLVKGNMALCRVPGDEVLSPGIYAHYYFNHADGAWLALYAWLRLEAGLEPENAYAEAVQRATGKLSWAEVDDLIPPNSLDDPYA